MRNQVKDYADEVLSSAPTGYDEFCVATYDMNDGIPILSSGSYYDTWDEVVSDAARFIPFTDGPNIKVEVDGMGYDGVYRNLFTFYTPS